MCIITDSNHKVISVSLIPGLGEVPANWNVYFPAKCENGIPSEGEIYKEN